MSVTRRSMNSWWYAIFSIVIGILLVVGGTGAATNISQIMVTIMGVILLAFGIVNLCFGAIFYGVGELVLGILMICFAWQFVWAAYLILAIMMLVNGVSGLVDHHTSVIVNILDIIVGLALFITAIGIRTNWANEVTNIFFYVTGALMIVDGILVLVRRH